MKINKKLMITTMLMGVFLLGGCRESDKVSYNVSQEADNFNVVRRVAVINARTDKIEFEVVGRISINAGSDQLEIMVEDENHTTDKTNTLHIPSVSVGADSEIDWFGDDFAESSLAGTVVKSGTNAPYTFTEIE